MTKSTVPEFTQDITEAIQELGKIEAYADAFQQLAAYATNLNQVFVQNRGRIVEMQKAIADTIPGVNRLGGSIKDVTDILGDVAVASRRNVIASSETVEKLYAASRILAGGEYGGFDVQTLVTSFADVGVSFEKIPGMLEDSIYYIQSVGGNSREVMKDVVNSANQLNRFRFEGGVQGLTKMAAQASMLRMNMSDTFALAEKVMDPDGAVEVASSFQRLGVSVGNLVDPFQLMNQSINDPSGLQDSLAKAAKQFVSFNKETKSFEVSRQGVFVLREMEKDAGLTAGSLSKAGLAAADLDRRVSQINVAGLKFKDEEDKQYLANIATMTKGGTYEVTLKDGTKKELSQLNQKEFDELIKEQKTGKKSLEDIQRSSLNTSELIKADVGAIKNKILFGTISADQIVKAGETVRGVTTGASGYLSGKESPISVTQVREFTEGTLQKIKEVSESLISADDKKAEIQKIFTELTTVLNNQGKGIENYFEQMSGQLVQKLRSTGLIDLISAYGVDLTSIGNTPPITPGSPTVLSPSSVLVGPTTNPNSGVLPTNNLPITPNNVTVTHNFNKVVVDITHPPQMDPTVISQILNQMFSSPNFANYLQSVYKAIQNGSPVPTFPSKL